MELVPAVLISLVPLIVFIAGPLALILLVWFAVRVTRRRLAIRQLHLVHALHEAGVVPRERLEAAARSLLPRAGLGTHLIAREEVPGRQ